MRKLKKLIFPLTLLTMKFKVPESVFMKLSEALRASATAAVRMADQFTARKLNGIVILYQVLTAITQDRK